MNHRTKIPPPPQYPSFAPRLVIFFSLLVLSATSVVPVAGALALGIAFSVIATNPYPAQSAKWSKLLLQLSVVGLGFGIGVAQVVSDGWRSILPSFFCIAATLLVGQTLGRIMKIDRHTSYLISFGTAICGGSAIAALAPAIKARHEQVAVALATVFTLNALALLTFPALGRWLALTQAEFGLWAALAIHDTSSVVGAASSYGNEALEIAVTAKLTRALWIAPSVLCIAMFWRSGAKARVPLFILGFIAAAVLRTLFPGQQELWDLIAQAARRLLVVTLFLIGSGVSRELLRTVGPRTFCHGFVLWLLVSSATLVAIGSGAISVGSNLKSMNALGR